MKLKVFLILVTCFQVNAAVYSQNKLLDVELKNVTLEQVIWELEKKTDFTFMYWTHEIKNVKNLSLDMKQKSINDILDFCLCNTDLRYEINGDAVVIHKLKTEKPEVKERVIKGVVKDRQGGVLPGVTVLVKGTAIGVATSIEGKFTMSVPKDTVSLLFSFVGMKTKEVVWTGQEMLTVVLDDDAQQVDEVVVTGYQTVNRRDMVGAYSVVKAADILMPNYSSIDQMLQGKVAGMVVVQTSSRVGTSPTIKIRGTSTILGNQSPLWVVDGIIQEDPIELNVATFMTQDLATIIGSQVSWLNPMDIETITVLKDASATAVYGSKASNGVIVITTKKGKADRLTVNYSGNISINSRPNYGQFNYMNSQERIIFSQEAFNAGAFYEETPIAQPYTYEGIMQMYLNHDISKEEFNQRKAYLESVNTDWFDLLTQSGVSTSHNVSVSGGSEKVTYNVSVGYSDMQGQEIGNSSRNLTGRVSVDIRLRENVRLGASINGSSGKNKAFGQDVNPMSYATNTSRAIPAYDENGEAVFYQKSATYEHNSNVKSLKYNFINERDNSGAQVNRLSLNTSLNFSWDIADWLKYEFTGGYSRGHINSESWALEQTFYIAENYRGYDYNSVDPGSAEFKAAMMPFGGELFTSDASQDSYNIQNKLLISKSFNDENRLNVMLGMEVRSASSKNNSNIAYGYLPDRGERFVIPPFTGDIQAVTGSNPVGWGLLGKIYDKGLNRGKSTDNYLSVFATLAYSWKNRYVFNFSVRNDFSNRFGQDVNNRLDPTYSFGVAWRVMEEPLLVGEDWWVNTLNLRATYGIQGNAMTRLGPDLILTQGGIAQIYNQYESTISSIPNPNLSWERTHSVDLGVDFGLFNMFNLAFDYYW